MNKQHFTVLIILLMAVLLLGCGHQHEYGAWTVERVASCEESGMEVRICPCGEQETRTIQPLGHIQGVLTITSEPTCTTTGAKQRMCGRCHTVVFLETIEPIGHMAGEWITDSQPTFLQEGSKHLSCAACGEMLQTERIPKLLIVVDAGHGGHDPGEVVESVREKNINLQIAKKLKSQLESYGITTILTREDDTFVSLEDRALLANEINAAYFISVHCNSYDENAAINGFEIYYFQNQDAKRLADRISSDLKSAELVKLRGVKTDEYFVLKNTSMPAILLELGFLTNDLDRENLCSDTYQNLMTECIVTSILAFLGLE